MKLLALTALSLFASTWLAGCGSDTGDDPGTIKGSSGGAGQGGSAGKAGGSTCLPGQQLECACLGSSAKGVQICNADGKGLGPCSGCPGGMSGMAGSSGVGGAAGSSGQSGAGSGGAGQAGKGQGGAGQAGAGQAGAGQGGAGPGGAGQAGAGQAGSGGAGSGNAGQAGTEQGGAGSGAGGEQGGAEQGGAGQEQGGAGQGGISGSSGQGGAGQAGAAGGEAGAAGDGGGAGQAGAAGGGGQAGAGQAGAGNGGGGSTACGQDPVSPWSPGDPVDSVSLILLQSLSDGAYEPRSPLHFVADGSVAFRVAWGGHLMRYERDTHTGKLTVQPHPKPAGFANAASLLVHPRNNRLIAGMGYSYPDGGAIQLHELLFPAITLGNRLESSNTNAALIPDPKSSCVEPWACGSFDVRALAVHPSNRWLYAHFTQNNNPDNQSSLSVFELGPDFTGFNAPFYTQMISKQKVIYPAENGQGVSLSPDGQKLFVSSVNRLFVHDVDPLTGALSAAAEVALAGPEVQGKTMGLYEGATCQRGGTYHHYAPLWTHSQSGVPTAGLWHTAFKPGQAQPTSSRVYSISDAPGLARVRHLVATKDCSRLFVAGSQNTGDSQFTEGYRPELLVFNVDRGDGSLKLESSLKAGADFSGVQREMLLSLSPDERHLYAGQEWASNVAVFEVKHDNRGASGDPLVIQLDPETPQRAFFPANPRHDLYGNNECPAGQVLTGFAGFYNDCSTACSYGLGIKRISAVCSKVTVQPGAPPTVQLSPGMTGTQWGFWPQAKVPWNPSCPEGQVVVGHRFALSTDNQLGDVELHCAPLKIACSLPYQLEIDTSNITVVQVNQATSHHDPNRPLQMCPPGTVGHGLNTQAGEVIDNLAVQCARPKLVVSPGECSQDSDCEAGDSCGQAQCIQGMCQEARKPFGSPARIQSGSCMVECRNLGWTTHDLADAGVAAGYFAACGACSGGEFNPEPAGTACSFGGGKECSPGGMCIQDWN